MPPKSATDFSQEGDSQCPLSLTLLPPMNWEGGGQECEGVKVHGRALAGPVA